MAISAENAIRKTEVGGDGHSPRPIAIIDTNVWVDAFGIGETKPGKSMVAKNTIAKIISNCDIVGSRLTANELERVLRRIEEQTESPEGRLKVRQSGQKLIDSFVKNVKLVVYDEREFIRERKNLPPPNNFPDQVFFALAEKTSAHVIVSFDHHMRDVGSYKGTEVISPYDAVRMKRSEFEYFLDSDNIADEFLR